MTQFPMPMQQLPPMPPEPMVFNGREWVPLSMTMPPPPGVPQPGPIPGAMGGAPPPPPPLQQAGGPSGAQMMPAPTPPQPMPLDVDAIAGQILEQERAKMAPFGPGLFGGGVAMPLDTGGGGYRAPTPGFSTAEFAPPLPRAGADRLAGLDAIIAAMAARRGPVPEAYQPSAEEVLQLQQRVEAQRLAPEESAGALAALKARQAEKFAERREARVPDAKRRELVMAKARGESPLETRLALGTISPEDLAVLAGPQALLATPEAQAARAAHELDVARLNLEGRQAEARAAVMAAGQPDPGMLGSPLPPLPGDVSPEAAAVVAAAERLPEEVAGDPIASERQIRAQNPGLSDEEIDRWGRRTFGDWAWKYRKIPGGGMLAKHHEMVEGLDEAGLAEFVRLVAPILSAGVIPPPFFSTPSPRAQPPSYQDVEAQALGPINESRRRQGLPPLQ